MNKGKMKKKVLQRADSYTAGKESFERLVLRARLLSRLITLYERRFLLFCLLVTVFFSVVIMF